MNAFELAEQPEHTLPKPGVRGSIPIRDAIFQGILGVRERTKVNSGALTERFDGSEMVIDGKGPRRGYTVVTGSKTNPILHSIHLAGKPNYPTPSELMLGPLDPPRSLSPWRTTPEALRETAGRTFPTIFVEKIRRPRKLLRNPSWDM